MRWAGHVVHMGKIKDAFGRQTTCMTKHEPEGKFKNGSYIWCLGVDGIHLAEDSYQWWWTFVNMVVKVGISHKASYLFPTWASVSFLKKAMPVESLSGNFMCTSLEGAFGTQALEMAFLRFLCCPQLQLELRWNVKKPNFQSLFGALQCQTVNKNFRIIIFVMLQTIQRTIIVS
jgi:hypothetical protein